MIGSFGRRAAKFVLLAGLINPQISAAEGFTGTEFLAWNGDAQRGYIDAQLVMASSIAARIKPEMSQCLADVYYGPTGLTDDGYAEILSSIREFNTYHPSSVLVVMIEKECGGFD